MVDKKLFTVLVQGPLNSISLDQLECYCKYGDIVISTWGGDLSLLSCVSNVNITVRDLPTKKQQTYKQPTAAFQFWSIYYGLQLVQTPFVIRTRSDEYYGNFDPLLDVFYNATHKITCGNIFFKTWGRASFHMGDHLFVGATGILREAYRRLCHEFVRFNAFGYAEQSAANAIMEVLTCKKGGCTREDFVNCFDVVNIRGSKFVRIPFFTAS